MWAVLIIILLWFVSPKQVTTNVLINEFLMDVYLWDKKELHVEKGNAEFNKLNR